MALLTQAILTFLALFFDVYIKPHLPRRIEPGGSKSQLRYSAVMQQIAPSLTAHRLPDPILRDILARRIAGQPLTRLAADLSLSLSTLHHVTADLCATKDDVAALDDRAKIRACMCCRRPLLSQHSGHRLCRSCAAGVEPSC